MSKFTDNASEKLLVVAGKISNQKHMASIKNAFYTLMPVILTGAFCTLISNVVCSTTTTGISLAKLPGMSWLGMFTDLFNAANYATLNFFTVAAVFLIGMELAKQNGLGESPDSGVVAVCSFISVLPTYVVTTVNDVQVTVPNVLGKDYTAARGLFLGMVIALDAGAAQRQAVLLGVVDGLAAGFQILFDVAVGGLVLNAGHRARQRDQELQFSVSVCIHRSYLRSCQLCAGQAVQ